MPTTAMLRPDTIDRASTGVIIYQTIRSEHPIDGAVDPTGATVDLAAVLEGTRPTTWTAGSWETGTVDLYDQRTGATVTYYVASATFASAFGTPGIYRVWARLDSVKILEAGVLTVT